MVDIATAALGRTALPLPAAVGAVREVRVAHRDGDLRIVFDLAAAMRPQSATDGEGSAARLTIELQPVATAQVAAATEPSPPVAVNVPAPTPVSEPKTVPVPPPAAAKPVRPARDIMVVVDAGHGGHDPGAIGARGLREKDVTLAISRRLVDRLNGEPGHARRPDAPG